MVNFSVPSDSGIYKARLEYKSDAENDGGWEREGGRERERVRESVRASNVHRGMHDQNVERS